MSKEGLSRRSFLRSTAVGSTGAAAGFPADDASRGAEAPPAATVARDGGIVSPDRTRPRPPARLASSW